MKSSKMTLLSVTILVSLMVGTVVLNAVSAWTWMSLWWSPRSYELGTPMPDPWKAVIFGFSPRARDIDPSTILLEGVYSPDPEVEPYLSFWGLMLVVSFDGLDVVNALLIKGGHLSPGENIIYLEITGQTYGGKSFAESGRISLIAPEGPPP